MGEFDQFVRDQLCARFDGVLASLKDRKRHNDARSKAEIGAHLKQHLDALQSQMQLAVRMKEFDIAVELEDNVRHVQDELAVFKAEQAMVNGTEEMQHAELLRMKEEALHYRSVTVAYYSPFVVVLLLLFSFSFVSTELRLLIYFSDFWNAFSSSASSSSSLYSSASSTLLHSADLRRALMDLADSHAALLMGLEPLMDAGRGADADEIEGIAAASYTASRVGEAASQVAHDLQLLVQGNAAEDAAMDDLAESAAAALIGGRTISATAKKALEERVARNSSGDGFGGGADGDGGGSGGNHRRFTPDDEVLFRDVSHHRNIVSRLVGTSATMNRVVDEEPTFVGAVAAGNDNEEETY